LGKGGEPSLVAAGRLGDFRCAFGRIAIADGVTLDASCAQILHVGPGDPVTHVARV
jgi:arginine N-succinyltransferase